MEPPVEYAGGLSEDERRPRAWPFVAAAVALAAVIIAVIVFWGPIRAAGRSAGESFASYSMSLTSAKWPSDVQLTGVPTTLAMTLQNTDRRALNGVTLRVATPNPGLTVVQAGPAAEIGGSAIFFPVSVAPGKSETLSVTFLAVKPMNGEIDFSLAAARGTNPAQVLTPDGTVATELAIAAKFRDPTDADANARLVAIYPSQVTTSASNPWVIHVTNTGPVPIRSVSLAFANPPTGFQLLSASPIPMVQPSGQLQFDVTLPPGGQITLILDVALQQAGAYQIPAGVYLNGATTPLSLDPGVTALIFVVTAT
jgi:hypothetical protein